MSRLFNSGNNHKKQSDRILDSDGILCAKITDIHSVGGHHTGRLSFAGRRMAEVYAIPVKRAGPVIRNFIPVKSKEG